MMVCCLCTILAVCMAAIVAAGGSNQTNREEIETANELNVISDEKYLSERMIGVVDAVGLAFGAIGFITSLSGGDASQFDEINERLAGIENSLEIIESDLGGIINDITHSQNLNAITPSYMRLKNYISDYVDYMANDVSIPQGWIDTILAYGDEGMKQTLNNFNRMIIGDPPFFSSILVTFEEAELNMRDSSYYYDTLREFVAYMLSLQVAGYAIHINVLILNGASYDSVQRDMEDQVDLQEDLIRALLLKWPAGTWGLPEAKIGCPVRADVAWRHGTRYQSTESSGSNDNRWGGGAHFPPLQSGRWRWVNTNMDYPTSKFEIGMKQYFCMKDEAADGEGEWPAGSYCIFKKSGCPAGFYCDGFAFWDDDDYYNENTRTGSLPDGGYNTNTHIYYACRDDGDPTHEIELPTQRQFHLFRYGGTCQKVKNAAYREEFIFWDTEDHNNDDFKHSKIPDSDFTNDGIRFRYCYYESTLFSHE